MNDTETLKDFFELLETSGMPEERRLYWLNRIGAGAFSESDHPFFTAELNEHLDNVETALAASEIQLEEAKERFGEVESMSLPLLRGLAAKQADYQADEAKEYKNAILHGEKEMSAKIESFRGRKQSEDIEALRRKLLS